MVQAFPGGAFSPRPLLVKVVSGSDALELEQESNEFRRNNNVRFSQSHIEKDRDGDFVYFEFLYYEPRAVVTENNKTT